MKGEFEEVYNAFKKEIHLLTVKIVEFQEDTLMALVTCKDMEQWYKRSYQAVEILE